MKTGTDAPADNEGAVKVILFVMFLNALGANLVVPLLPFVAIKFNASALGVAAMTSCFSLAQAVGGVVLGMLSDKFGRKLVLLACLGGGVVSLISFGMAPSFAYLLVFRSLHGFFDGTTGICQAFACDLVAPDQQASTFAKITAAFGLGMVLGPGIGGALFAFGFSTVAFSAAGLTMLPLLAGYFSLPPDEPATADKGTEENADTQHEISMKQAIRIEPDILLFYILQLSQYIVMGCFFGVAALFFHQHYGYGGASVGKLFCTAGISMVLFSSICTKRAIDAFGETRCIIIGNAARFLVFLLIVIVEGPWVPFAFAMTIVCTGGLINPCSTSIVMMLTPFPLRGESSGIFQALGSVGMMIGPIIAGAVYETDNYYPFVIAAGLSVLNSIFSIVLHWRIDPRIEELKSLPVAAQASEEDGKDVPLLEQRVRAYTRRASLMESIHTEPLQFPSVLLHPDTGSCHFGMYETPNKIERRKTISGPLWPSDSEKKMKRFSTMW